MSAYGKGQQGLLLWELTLVIMIMAVLAALAFPGVFKFYRQAAVEYEAEHLLADIRRCQSLSRASGSSAWKYGADSSADTFVHLVLEKGRYTTMAGNLRTLERHAYLAGVKAVKENNTTYATRADIAFSQEGTPRSVESMMTILIYYQGYEQEGRRIMISKGGRIRMERGQHGG